MLLSLIKRNLSKNNPHFIVIFELSTFVKT